MGGLSWKTVNESDVILPGNWPFLGHSLTENHQDKQDTGETGHHVEHQPQIIAHCLQFRGIRHQHGWQHEADGDAQLEEGKSSELYKTC